jgi:carboxypeptidase Q
MKILSSFILLMMAFLGSFAQEKVDLNMMAKIREQGLVKSQVMDIALNLTDLNGNRLANSPGYTKAANYAKNKLSVWFVIF